MTKTRSGLLPTSQPTEHPVHTGSPFEECKHGANTPHYVHNRICMNSIQRIVFVFLRFEKGTDSLSLLKTYTPPTDDEMIMMLMMPLLLLMLSFDSDSLNCGLEKQRRAGEWADKLIFH